MCTPADLVDPTSQPRARAHQPARRVHLNQHPPPSPSLAPTHCADTRRHRSRRSNCTGRPCSRKRPCRSTRHRSAPRHPRPPSRRPGRASGRSPSRPTCSTAKGAPATCSPSASASTRAACTSSTAPGCTRSTTPPASSSSPRSRRGSGHPRGRRRTTCRTGSPAASSRRRSSRRSTCTRRTRRSRRCWNTRWAVGGGGASRSGDGVRCGATHALCAGESRASRPSHDANAGVARRLEDWPHDRAVECGVASIRAASNACTHTLRQRDGDESRHQDHRRRAHFVGRRC